jgi:hypothetical protein
LPFEHLGALLGQRRHKNAQKSLRQAVKDRLKLNLVSFCDFSPFLPFFADFGGFFYLKEKFLKG